MRHLVFRVRLLIQRRLGLLSRMLAATTTGSVVTWRTGDQQRSTILKTISSTTKDLFNPQQGLSLTLAAVAFHDIRCRIRPTAAHPSPQLGQEARGAAASGRMLSQEASTVPESSKSWPSASINGLGVVSDALN